jgi:magnesium transporter
LKVTCFAFEPTGGLRPEAEATAVAEWRAGAGPYWIDLDGGRPEAVTVWLSELGLDPGLFDLLQIGDNETRILPLAEAVYVAYPVPTEDEAGKPAHVGILCLDRLVITMHEQPAGYTVHEAATTARLKLREATTAGVVCALALIHSTHFRHLVVRLREEGDVLTDRMDSDPESVSLAEIMALKRRVLAYGNLVDEELAVFEALKACNTPVLPLATLAGQFQNAIETMRATDRNIDRLDRRVGDLQRRYESIQQDKTNSRLAVLTILSAIFMPITLITGIYGMNFDVQPVLSHYRYGYLVILGVMALIAGGLYWYFRSRGWLK